MTASPSQAPAPAPAKPAAHAGEWANPAPAGLVALAIACFCFFAVLTGQVGRSSTPFLACWLIGGFVVQFTVGVIELKEKALTGGNIFLFFSAFFMLTGGLKYLVLWVSAHMPVEIAGKEVEIDHHIDGWAWMVLALALLTWTPAYLKQGALMLTMVVLFLDIAVPFVALRDLGWVASTVANPIAGWTLLAAGICGLYVAAAIICNGAFGRAVFPMPGPILK